MGKEVGIVQGDEEDALPTFSTGKATMKRALTDCSTPWQDERLYTIAEVLVNLSRRGYN